MSTKRFSKKKFTKGKGRMASKAYVKKAILKTADIGFVDQVVNLTNTIFTHTPVLLSGIPEGDTDSSRDGQSVGLLSLQMRLQGRPNATTATDAHCRVIIFKWHRTANPATNSLLLNSGTLQAPISFYTKTTSKGQFQILYTRMFNISSLSANDHVTFKMFRKLKGLALFSSNVSTAHTKGSIWLQVVSNLAANGPEINIGTRLHYTK